MTKVDEKVTLPELEDKTVVERVNKKDMTPLFNANHVHQYVKGDEETDDYYDEVCTIKDCGMGRLIAKR